jgi:outer membrane autotransporter protein
MVVSAPGDNLIQTDGPTSDGLQVKAPTSATLTSEINATQATVVTAGTNSRGASIDSTLSGSAKLTMSQSAITTSGNAADGVFASGARASADVTASTIATHGQNAIGVRAEGGASVTLHSTAISTGPDAADGTAGIGILSNSSTITVDAGGGASPPSSVQTGKDDAPAVAVVGKDAPASITLGDGVSLTTLGKAAHGVQAISQAHNVTVSMGNGTISTGGTGSYGVYAVGRVGAAAGAASVTLSGTTVATSGANGDALYAGFAGMSGAKITGSGAIISTSNDDANGATILGAGNDIQLDAASSIATSGARAHAIALQGGATKTFAAGNAAGDQVPGTISVSGTDAAVFDVKDAGSKLVFNQYTGLPTATLGADSWGMIAQDGGRIELNGTSPNGYPLWARGSVGAVGTIAVSGASDLSTSRVRVDDNGLFQLAGTTPTGLTIASLEGNGGEVQLGLTGAARDLTVGGTGSGTYSGAITGFGNLVRSGSGTLTLNGNSGFGFTGDVLLNSGTLATAGTIQAPGKNFRFATTGNLDISQSTAGLEVGAINSNGAGDGQINLGQRTLTVNSDNASAGDFSGTIAGTGALLKNGTSRLTLSGPNVFDYTGGTTIQQGTLAATGNASASGKPFYIASAGTLDLTGVNTGFTAGSIDSTDGGGTVHLGANTLTLDGAGTHLYAGTIDGTGSLIKTNALGTVKLSGDNAFSYTGNTTIDGGVLAISGLSNTAAFNKNVTLNGGWLDLSESNLSAPDEQTANNWPGLTITEGPNASQGGIIGNNDKVSYDVAAGATQVVDYALGDGSTPMQQGLFLVKTGAGTLDLTHANSYVGNTRIEGGVLRVHEDANMGDVAAAREVVLDGGGLDIAGSFTTLRPMELRQSGTVSVDDGQDTTWAAAYDNGAGSILTKQGGGRLAFSGASQLGGVVADGGTLDMGQAAVTTTTSNPAVTAHQGTVSFNGGQISSAGDAIVADGNSVVNLTNTAVAAGPGQALYRVRNAAVGVLNASAQSLNGAIVADGAGSQVQLNLQNGSVYTGTPQRLNGGTMKIAVADASSTWMLDGDATVDGLTNAGRVVIGSQGSSTSGPAAYRGLSVNGDYAGNGGSVEMNTELNAGGNLSDQHTDRLLVNGNATGQTSLVLHTTGSGADTGASQGSQNTPSQGISLVQVAGASSADAFKLAGGYVVAAKSPFQYRLFAYGPGQTDPGQSLLSAGTQWDYRLQTAYLDDNGNPSGGDPDGGGPGSPGGGRPALVPQGSSYLVANQALLNYGAAVMDNLHRRLGEIRRDDMSQDSEKGEMFARAIGSTGSYRNSLGNNQYGYDFKQDISALQIGGNWLHVKRADQDLRLGAAVTTGSTSFNPSASSIEDSKASVSANNLALTATWQHRDGWYVDGVVSAGHYYGNIDTSQRGKAGRIDANALDFSVEGGKTMKLSNGFEWEPQVQIMRQSLRFDNTTNPDGVDVDLGNSQAWTGRIGVRVARPIDSTTSWTPYARVSLLHTWNDTPDAQLSGTSFETGRSGSAVQVGVGATGMITPRFSLYGELVGQQRIGSSGNSGVSATVGVKYQF